MFREATEADLAALRDLERAANQAALAHVFPPERYPFPDDDVLARWRLVLDDPTATVLVVDCPDPGSRRTAGELHAYVAFDDRTLRHLAVHPDAWGRGLATSGVEAALHAMDRCGSTEAELWCLDENHRARRLYRFLGWRPTEESRPAPWPPYPTERRWSRLIVQSER